MASPVEELQSEAINKDVDVATLLRKASVIASRLNLNEFEQWINYELNGYRGVDAPIYRQLRGRVVMSNRGFTPIPIRFESHEMEEIVSTYHLQVPIGTIIDHVRDSKPNQKFAIDFPLELQALLLKQFPGATGIPFLEFERTHYTLILEVVRNEILKWCNNLQSDGITGEGQPAGDVVKAEENKQDLLPPVIYQFGDVTDSIIQLASPGASGTVIHSKGKTK